MAASNNSLFFEGFDQTTTKEMISFVFGKYGTIKKIEMLRDENGQFLGSGSVEFNDEIIAEKVLCETSGMNIYGNHIIVSISESKKKIIKCVSKNLHANICDKMQLNELHEKLNKLMAVVIAKGVTENGLICCGNAQLINRNSNDDLLSVSGNALFVSIFEEDIDTDCVTHATKVSKHCDFDLISKLPFNCNFLRRTSGLIDSNSQLCKILKRFAGVSLKIQKYESNESCGYKFFCVCSPIGESYSEAETDELLKSEFFRNENCESNNNNTLDEPKTNENENVGIKSSEEEAEDDLDESEFIVQYVDCILCFNEHFVTECVHLFCDHVICVECFLHFIQHVIRDNKISPIRCPNCGQEIEYDLVVEYISNELLAKYETRLYENYLESADDIINCPKLRCTGLVCLTNDPTLGVCQTCNYTFCTNCEEEYHGSTPCDQFENDAHKQQVLQNYLNGGDETKQSLEKRFTKKKLEDLVEESLSSECIKTNCKPCPSCNAKIEKIGGCNKLICTKCNTFFCWLCNEVLNKANPYAHFKPGACYV